MPDDDAIREVVDRLDEIAERVEVNADRMTELAEELGMDPEDPDGFAEAVEMARRLADIEGRIERLEGKSDTTSLAEARQQRRAAVDGERYVNEWGHAGPDP